LALIRFQFQIFGSRPKNESFGATLSASVSRHPFHFFFRSLLLTLSWKLHILTMTSKSRKAAVCATAAAFIVGTASASKPSSSFPHGGSVTRAKYVEGALPNDSVGTTCSLQLHGLLACPRGGAEPDESKKKRKSKRRKAQKAAKDAAAKSTTEEESSTASPAKDSKSHPPRQQEESSASAEKEKTDAPKPKPKQQTPSIIEEILKEKDYYKILGTTKQDAQNNPTAITKAYRRRAVQTHPDKTGGDRRAFDIVAEAYDVLSDDSKRQIYDRFGKQGLDPTSAANNNNGPAGFSQAEDLFRSFFGGSSARNPYFQPPRRNRTVRYQLEVSLEDLYQGIERTVLVAPPEGGPGSSTSQKRVNVHVTRGALSGQSIVLSGEMDFDETDTPGDLVFWLVQQSHPTFTRKGHDLALTLRISLQEAICGVTRNIRHLDGRELTIGSARQVTHGPIDPILIQTGDVQVLKGKGMPKDGQGTEFGDLYVQYEVEMPTGKPHGNDLTSEEREELGRLLDKLQGKKHLLQGQSDSDIQYLQKASLGDFGRASGRPQPTQNNDPTREDDERRSQFGSRQFHYSSSRGSSPFFETNPGYAPDDDGSAQCRQM
jgi:DnaJ-class molecular chaperone